jgi:hypothetical protein
LEVFGDAGSFLNPIEVLFELFYGVQQHKKRVPKAGLSGF